MIMPHTSQRNKEVPDGHPLQCVVPGCPLQRRIKEPLSLCSKHAQRWKRGTLKLALDDKGRWVELLPEDGIIDPKAVEIAVKGWRLVQLTRRERLIAAALIMADPRRREAAGSVISRNLGINLRTAWRLVEDVKIMGIDVAAPGFFDDDAVNNQDDPTVETET